MNYSNVVCCDYLLFVLKANRVKVIFGFCPQVSALLKQKVIDCNRAISVLLDV